MVASVDERLSAHFLGNAPKREAVTGRRHPALSAREWFAVLRPRLLASRPVLVPARREKRPGKAGANWSRTYDVPPVYGPPTFRNVLDQDGIQR
jgi:hypothetical protein